jgi:dolichol-phosphate hexosyltransferase
VSKISIVIPALNERDGITRTIQAIPKAELENLGYEVQILVVDNGSSDDTGNLAKKAGADVVFEPRRGYGRAFKTGFEYAKGDIVVTADADATYPLEGIPKLVRILEEEELDFLTTDRFSLMEKGVMSSRNILGNKILSLTMRVLFGLGIKDSQSGMWVFRRSILPNLKLKSNTPLSQELKIEACHFAGCRWKEVPIEYRPRLGKVKLGGWKVGFGNLLDLIRKRIIR